MTTVDLTTGTLAGVEVTGGLDQRPVHWFGSVPYASAGRFRLPEPVRPWAGVRDATVASAAPPQRPDGLDLVPGMTPDATSEDCLTAEVWTPDPDGSAPVLVWIPGGSYRVGGAGLPTYDGRHLAADGDLVVVGLNYRLGLLGFLHADGVPSNLGLRDLRAALDWIRAEVGAFGGDPRRITLMGESAGAGCILHLLTDPHLDVAGAIVLSGSPTMTQSAATAATVAATVLDLGGVANAAGLGDRTTDDLLDVQSQAVAALARSVGMMPFHPWVDGEIVPSAPLVAMAEGTMAPVPLVVCTTAQEMELFRDSVPQLPAEYAHKMLGPKAAQMGIGPDGVQAGYAACGEDLVSAVADVDLCLPALRLADHHRARNVPVWRVSFDWQSAAHRACHAVDLPFHFGTLDVAGWRDFAAAHDPAADRLSARIRQAWASFAHTGTPACDPVGQWPGYDGSARLVVLDREVTVHDDAAWERLGSWG